ncbi:GTPase Era, mitochondrial-like [Stegodyphus dumicola]|uniref:GTPase Era, mitochondrial-like n=1 Tax=Stegodyphus dumicola TaxID=202533 RepID=UPI0015AFAF16|nr:GTPase Era, mitochondrial-like [Stegodyphus dumicola]
MAFSSFSKYAFLYIRGPLLLNARAIGNVSAPFGVACKGDVSVEVHEGPVNSSIESHNDDTKKVPLTLEEYKKLRGLEPFQPEDPHILKVSILGEPNVGKSTLTNSLVKWKICAVSRKVHTTRKKAAAVLIEGNKQIVFLDTPGFVSAEQTIKHKLEPSFIMDPLKSIRDAHLIAVVIDISNRWTNNKINGDILEVLNEFKHKKSILILNKVDAMKSKTRLLSLTRILTGGGVSNILDSNFEKTSGLEEMIEKQKELKIKECDEDENEEQKRGWPFFSNVFMVSALKNEGVDDLRRYLLNEAVPGKWMYHSSVVTDQHPHELALMIVREKLLDYLPEEIPYNINLRVSKWELLSTGCPKIDIKIICQNSRHKRFVLGPNGKHIALCADKSRRAMREAFRRDVVLHLGVA